MRVFESNWLIGSFSEFLKEVQPFTFDFLLFFRVFESGQTPYFCFHDGFCRYFDDRRRLTEHYAKNPTHNISQPELNKLRKKSLEVQEKRKKVEEEIVKSSRPKSPSPIQSNRYYFNTKKDNNLKSYLLPR